MSKYRNRINGICKLDNINVFKIIKIFTSSFVNIVLQLNKEKYEALYESYTINKK